MIEIVHDIIKRYIFAAYISNIIIVWSLDNINILDTIIMYKYWTVLWLFEYFRNGYKNKKGLVQSIDKLKIKSVNDIIKILVLVSYILNMIFGWLIKDKYIIDTITKYNYCTLVQSLNC